MTYDCVVGLHVQCEDSINDSGTCSCLCHLKEKLRMQRYLMVGAGGTGTHLIAPLMAYLKSLHAQDHMPEFEFGVIDGDEVEEKNFARQLFDPDTVSVNKARAAVTQWRDHENVRAIPEYLSKDNMGRFITDGSVVLIAVDNFPVRYNIEQHCKTLDNVVVINGGNEEHTGSCQIWVRQNGKNITPSIGFMHPEISPDGIDRADLSCQQVAELPGGEQLIVANMASAMWMLSALMDFHRNDVKWTELHFDALNGKVESFDMRDRRGWA